MGTELVRSVMRGLGRRGWWAPSQMQPAGQGAGEWVVNIRRAPWKSLEPSMGRGGGKREESDRRP